MKYNFGRLKPNEDFALRHLRGRPRRWLNLPDLPASRLFYSSGKKAQDIIVRAAFIGKDVPLKGESLTDEVCTKWIGQILEVIKPVLPDGITDEGTRYLVAMDSVFSARSAKPAPFDLWFPPSVYYAAFAFYWLDLALVSFNKTANDDAAYYVSVATQCVAKAEAYTSTKKAMGVTSDDLNRVHDSGVAERKRKVAKTGATATGKLSEERRRITAEIYEIRKKYHNLSAANAAVRILPDVQKACKQLMPDANSNKPKPGIGVVVDVIRKLKKKAPR